MVIEFPYFLSEWVEEEFSCCHLCNDVSFLLHMELKLESLSKSVPPMGYQTFPMFSLYGFWYSMIFSNFQQNYL